MMYLKEEKFVIPWFNYWKTKSLTGSRLSYFCTIAEQQLREHPDYEEAEFHILDFRHPMRTRREISGLLTAQQCPK